MDILRGKLRVVDIIRSNAKNDFFVDQVCQELVAFFRDLDL